MYVCTYMLMIYDAALGRQPVNQRVSPVTIIKLQSEYYLVLFGG